MINKQTKKYFKTCIRLFITFLLISFINSQSPNSYPNLMKSSDLPKLLDQHQTVFLFFYHSSLLNYKLILNNLTKVRKMKVFKHSKVRLHTSILNTLIWKIHFVSIDANKHKKLYREHNKRKNKFKKPLLAAVTKFKTKIFQKSFTFKNLFEFASEMTNDKLPIHISSLSEYKEKTQNLKYYFVRHIFN
jgi:Trk-type K+ transport system membrane component